MGLLLDGDKRDASSWLCFREEYDPQTGVTAVYVSMSLGQTKERWQKNHGEFALNQDRIRMLITALEAAITRPSPPEPAAPAHNPGAES